MAAGILRFALAEAGQPRDRLADPAYRLARLKVEDRSMTGADNAVISDLAPAERHRQMRAQIVHRKKLSIEVHDHDAAAIGIKAARRVEGNIAGSCKLVAGHLH